jgi:putative DNA methylase
LDSQCLIITDPPYFSAIGYANLPDYFYPWIRLSLRSQYPDLLATMATPKSGELIAEPARHASKEEAKQYFIDGFKETFESLRSASHPDLPLLIVYAYKEQETEKDARVSAGWEAMLEAVIRSGLSIVGTWPIHGTGAQRMIGLGNNALATYVVLVCRPLSSASVRVSRRDLATALRAELGPAIQVLKSAAVAPVDLAQAVIGPGMAVFTRYQSVLEPDGTPMKVRSALLLINLVLAEVLDEQEGEFDSDSRWAVTWFEQFQFGEAPSGDADALARAKVTSIDGLERAGVIVTRAGTCRLLRRDELPENYDPAEDHRPTVWESVQHLVNQLLAGGEEQAAKLLARLSNSEASRDLAYRLYAICERKGWAEEAGAYNVLVASWPEIARLAAQLQAQQRDRGQLPGLE